MAENIEKSLLELDFASLTRRAFTPSPATWEDQVLYFLLLDPLRTYLICRGSSNVSPGCFISWRSYLRKQALTTQHQTASELTWFLHRANRPSGPLQPALPDGRRHHRACVEQVHPCACPHSCHRVREPFLGLPKSKRRIHQARRQERDPVTARPGEYGLINVL
jgi:hypothetical protein